VSPSQGDFTSGCTIEAQSFERDIDAYKSLNVQVVGVSVDTVDKHLDFGKRYGLDFPLLSDQGGKVSDQYGSLLNLGFLRVSNRQTYIISPMGKVEYVFTNVDSHLAEHSQDVLKVLRQLQERDNAAV
jgi:peroxiredoxin Q/BCP